MYFLPQLSSQSGVSLNASYQICQVRFGPRAAPGRARAAAHGAAPLRGQPAGVCGFRITLPNLLPKLTTNKQRCEKPRIVTGRRDFGWERSSRGRFATPADSPLHDCSAYSHVHVQRERFGVHRSRAVFGRAVPKIVTIRNCFIAVHPSAPVPLLLSWPVHTARAGTPPVPNTPTEYAASRAAFPLSTVAPQ